MFGIAGAVTGVLGMLSNVAGGQSQGCGLQGGLGNIISKFLDPLGILGGDEQKGLSQETKDYIEAMFEKYLGAACEESDLACQCEEDSSVSDITGDNWQNIFISTGSGDDTVTIG